MNMAVSLYMIIQGGFNLCPHNKRWISLSCTVGYKWVTVIDNVKLKFNNILL